jgi:polyhydroxyalkanoate synthase
VLVPSLINPPRILDLDEQVSLTGAIARVGRRAILLDWGDAEDRRGLSVAGHVEELLLPLLKEVREPPALVGYCLGGTMAIAAANLTSVERLATIAAPWNFAGYADASKQALADIWRHSEPAAKQLGALPMEVLLDSASADARRFVELEEWANEGEPLPYPAAKELIEDLFGRDAPGTGAWIASDRLAVPTLHLTADHDRIAPAATAPEGDTLAIASGHVGMIIGSARERLHAALAEFLAQ